MGRTLGTLMPWLTCCVLLGAVQADRVADLRAGSKARVQSSEAVRDFKELLQISGRAAEPNSHWQVELDSWQSAEESWNNASATLPPPFQGLKSCAVQLRIARGRIEQADELFRSAALVSDSSRAVELLTEHEKLQQQARDALQKTEQCYYAMRAQGGLLPSERPEADYRRELPNGAQLDSQRCRTLSEIATLYRQALASPSLTESSGWSRLDDEIARLFDPESKFHNVLMANCHCPVVTAKRRLERLRQLQKNAVTQS